MIGQKEKEEELGGEDVSEKVGEDGPLISRNQEVAGSHHDAGIFANASSPALIRTNSSLPLLAIEIAMENV